MQIYLEKDGKPFGPFSCDEVLAKLSSREIGPLDKAWREDMPNWKTVADALNVPKPPPLTAPTGETRLENNPPATPPLKSIQVHETLTHKTLTILRDVFIIYSLTFIGGLLVGTVAEASTLSDKRLHAGLANIVFLTVGFCIVGILNQSKRWRRLFIVAFFTWICGLFNIGSFGGTFEIWIMSSLGIFIFMGFGGWISILLKPPLK